MFVPCPSTRVWSSNSEITQKACLTSKKDSHSILPSNDWKKIGRCTPISKQWVGTLDPQSLNRNRTWGV